MSTRHLVDPQVLPLLDLMPFREFTREHLAQVRTESEQRFAFLGDPPLMPVVKVIDGPAGVPVELHSYPGAPHAFNVVPEAAIAAASSQSMLSAMARMLAV